MSELFSYWHTLVFILIFPLLVAGTFLKTLNLLFTAWMCGILVTGLVIMLGNAIGLSYQLAYTIGFVLLLPGMYRRIIHRSDFHIIIPATVFQWLCVGFTSVVLLLILFVKYIDILALPIMDWDAIAIYLNIVQALYYDLPFSELPWPERPNLGPTLWMMLMKISGGEPVEVVGRFIFPTLFIFWLLMYWEFVKSNIQAFSYMVSVIFCAFFFIDTGNYTVALNLNSNGYQDGFLTALAGCAGIFFCKTLLDWNEQRKYTFNQSLGLAVFFTSCLGFVKNEGLVIGLILFASFFVAVVLTTSPKNLRSWLKPYLFAAGIFGLSCLINPLLLSAHGIDASLDQGFSLSAIVSIFDNLDRWELIRPYLTVYLESRYQPIIASLIMSVGVFILVPKGRPIVIFLTSAWVAHMLFLVIIFMSTHYDLAWHLQTAFYRLAFQHSFIYVSAFCIYPIILANILTEPIGRIINKVSAAIPTLQPASERH